MERSLGQYIGSQLLSSCGRTVGDLATLWSVTEGQTKAAIRGARLGRGANQDRRLTGKCLLVSMAYSAFKPTFDANKFDNLFPTHIDYDAFNDARIIRVIVEKSTYKRHHPLPPISNSLNPISIRVMKRLREIFLEAALSIKLLSDATGFSLNKVALHLYETEMSMVSLYLFARALEVTPSWFLEEPQETRKG